MNKVSLNRQEIEYLIVHETPFVNLDISRFSTIFLAQYLQMLYGRTIDVHQMMDEIRFLEGERQETQTKNASMFKHFPLKGLMKKHFMDATFFIENIGNHFGMRNGGSKKLDQLVKKAFDENKSGYIDDQFIATLAHGFTFSAYEAKAQNKNLTGEWIVFREFEGSNYYLTLASHQEDDEEIYKRVSDAYEFDFSFLPAPT